MALIGSIAIDMKVTTMKLVKGVNSGRLSIAAFAAEAGKAGAFVGQGLTSAFTSMSPVLKNFTKGIFQAGAAITSGLGRAIIGVGRVFVGAIETLTRYGTVLTFLAGVALKHVITGSIALGEQTDRARIVFGQFADEVIDQSKLMADAFGISRREFIQSASAFGTIFEGVGYTQKDAAALSIHFVKLATDLSSLVHIPVAEAMEKIQSGLAGQIRPLREVGVFMSDDLVKIKAVSMGLAKQGEELTEAQKVQARVAFITEKLAIANGNLALTATSAANEMRSLSGRISNLGDTVGTALASIVGPALDDLNVAVQALTIRWNETSYAANAASVGVIGSAQAQTTAIGVVQRAIGWVADAWQDVRIAGVMAWQAIQQAVAATLDKVVYFIDELDRTLHQFAMMGNKTSGLSDSIKQLANGTHVLADETAAAVQKSLLLPRAHEQVDAYFERAREQIKLARQELTKPGVDITKLAPIAPAAAAAQAKIEGPKFASAMLAGSREANNAVLRAQFGGAGMPGNEPAKATAKNTERTVTVLEKIAAKLDAAVNQKVNDIAFGLAGMVGNF